MGMPLTGKPEISENAVSEGQDRPHRTSMDSPKAAQPSCLKGGFIRLFLKRTEQGMSPEDASSSNQSTEDKHAGRAKKRKVLSGNIFRLPCLRPAERTDTSEQINAQSNKVDEQGNQAIPEEELKPYSKASFLRKIRGYRLMRERDATEKEKVIEMEKCKEASVVEEHHGRKLELGGKVTEPRRYEDILGEKGKVSAEKGSQENMQGEKSKILEQERKEELSTHQGDSFREQENNDKNLRDSEKTMDKTDNCGMDTGVIRNDVEEHKNPAENVEELGNDLQEQVNCAGSAKGQTEEDILDQESNKKTVKDLGSKLTKQDEKTAGVSGPGNSMINQEINSQRAHELEDDLPQHNQLIHTKRAGVAANDLPENELIMEKAEKLTNPLQERPEENPGDMAKSSPKQHSNEGGVRTVFSEENKEGGVIQVIIGQNGHAEISADTQKKEDKLEESVKKLHENKGQDKNLEESENSLQDKTNHKENEDHLREEGNHAENVGESENHSQKQNFKTRTEGEAIEHTYSPLQKEEEAKDYVLEQDSHIQKEEKAVGLLEQDSHKGQKGKARDYLLKQDSHIQKEGKAGDQFLEEHNHIKKEGKAGDQVLEEDNLIEKEGKARDQFLEEDSHIQKEGKAGDQFLEEDSHIQKEGKAGYQILEEDSHIQKEGKAGDQFLEEDSHIQKEGKAGDQFLEEDSHIQKEGKSGDQFLEEDSHIQKEGKAEDQVLEEHNHIQKEGKAGDQFLEEHNHIQKEGKAEDQFLEQNTCLHKEGKAGDQFIEQESHIQKVEDVRDCLQAQKSNTENMGKPEALCLKQENHLGKTKAQIVAQDILEDGKDHLPEENKCVKKFKGLGKVFPEEVKDKTVQQVIQTTHPTATARSEEPCTELLTVHEQESATNRVDFNYYHQDGSQEDTNDSDDDDFMEDTDWRSLQVEVKGMVQWLVEEASDRLTCFTQESQGTE